MRITLLASSFFASLCLLACGPDGHSGDTIDAGNGGQPDAPPSPFIDGGPLADGGQQGCGEQVSCYTVYAHSDHVLYRLDLVNKQIETVGPFNAPLVMVGNQMLEDVITDLAVAPDDTIWGISKTNLYTASATDGHVTKVGSTASCGTQTVALTFTTDGTLLAGDFTGKFCKIDWQANPPTISQVAAAMGQNLALSGDMVALADGTLFGTAYNLNDGTNMGTQANNLLVKINPTTGQVTQTMGMTGYPKLFGVAYDQGQVFGFTHDQTGHVITIDPTTGVGTIWGTFNDPTTNMPISFAGAGVSPNVPPIGKPQR
jgi:hypothetical protein